MPTIRPNLSLEDAESIILLVDTFKEARDRGLFVDLFSGNEIARFEIIKQVLSKTISTYKANEIIRSLRGTKAN